MNAGKRPAVLAVGDACMGSNSVPRFVSCCSAARQPAASTASHTHTHLRAWIALPVKHQDGI